MKIVVPYDVFLTSRQKKLPLAVLVAPALAFGSLTCATVHTMADVPVNEAQQILAEDRITANPGCRW